MLRYWIWLSTRKYLTAREKVLLLERFQSPESVYLADEYIYRQIQGLSDRKIKCLMDKSLAEAESILRKCANKRVSMMTLQDVIYPQRLKHIDNPPLVLYYEGSLPHVDSLVTIGMVGTRKASAYGLKHAQELGYQLGRGGAVVVSGAAKGIDTACLKGALTAGRPVIAVLGNGTDVVYPGCNRDLYEDIRRNGCLISEYPPGTPSFSDHFPVRNRIISGLSLGVVVVEAPHDSGALITARRALDQGRDVFTIPGSLDTHTMAGNIQLMKDGAIIISNGADVLKEYAGQYAEVSTENINCDLQPEADDTAEPIREVEEKAIVLEKILPTGKAEWDKVLICLKEGSCHADDLVAMSELSASQVLSAVTMLEIKGYITRLPGKRFALAEKQ